MALEPVSVIPKSTSMSPQVDLSHYSRNYGPFDLQPALNEVKRLAEFQPEQPDLLQEWLKHPFFQEMSQRINQALNEFVEALLKLLSRTKIPGVMHLPENIRELFSGLVGFLIVLMGLFVLYLLFGQVLRWFHREPDDKPSESRVFDETQLINAEHHQQLAKQAAMTGHYTEGIRQYYLALLCYLDEAQLIPFSTTRSNREYVVLLPDKSPKEAFQGLAGAFESTRYGRVPGSEKDFNRCEQWYGVITEE